MFPSVILVLADCTATSRLQQAAFPEDDRFESSLEKFAFQTAEQRAGETRGEGSNDVDQMPVEGSLRGWEGDEVCDAHQALDDDEDGVNDGSEDEVGRDGMTPLCFPRPWPAR